MKTSPNTPRKRKWHKKGVLTLLKEKLEALQKQIVLKTYGSDCYTCPAMALEGKNCHLGHVPWPRSILGPKVKFDPRYTRAQCLKCNFYGGGMGAQAVLRMKSEGIDTDAMWAESQAEKGKMVPTQWYRDQIDVYKAKLKELSPEVS